MSRHLFFLRNHNDADNIVPVVWFLLDGDASARADIVFYNFQFPYLDHPYITALAVRFGDRLKIAWIGEFLGLSYDQTSGGEISAAQTSRIKDALRLEAPEFEKFFRLGKKQTPRRFFAAFERPQPKRLSLSNLVESTTRIISDARVPQDFRDEFIQWVIGRGETPCVAAFDHQSGTTLHGLINALRTAGVGKVVRLPVSPVMNINVLRETSDLFVRLDSKILEAELDFTVFDAISFTDQYYPASISEFCKALGWSDPFAAKLRILGSIRYCREWLAERPLPSPFTPSTGDDDRIKIVFFLSRRRTNTYWEEVERTIRVLDCFPRFQVVVQPHPRGAEPVVDIAGTRAEICTSASAASLVQWADVVLLWGSSIGLEALLADKTLLCLDYVNANRNLYEMLGGAWILRCRDDLVLALAQLERDPKVRPYQDADADRLIREIVLAGGGDPVPARYLNFLRTSEYD